MFLSTKIRSMLRKNQYDFMGLIFGLYPRFVLSDRFESLEDLPVFVFHRTTRITLEPLLSYLAENGYRTLKADEVYERYAAGVTSFDKEAVLTFDDGDKSLSSVAYPLLRKYGFTGVALIVPGLIEAGGLGQYWTPASDYLCSWQEIREIDQSGVIDFQAHSMYHHTVFVSPKIIGYVTPSTKFDFLGGDIFPVMENGGHPEFPDALPLGAPVYESAFRLLGRVRYIDSLGFRKACAEFVSQQGAQEFFQHKRWKQRMNGFVRRVFKDFAKEARYERTEEKGQAICRDFRMAKDMMEKNLKTKNVRHFCFPWSTGCPLAVKISREEGYVTNFWGGLVPKFAKTNNNPVPVPRLNPLYIWRLPGKGRRSLRDVLKIKYSSVITQRLREHQGIA